MKILGISAFYHDSAACIIDDGEIKAAAQEERFSRNKHDSQFPSEAIRFCLNTTGTSIDELEAVVFYDKPLLKFERLLETYLSFAPRGVKSFFTAIPVWLREKMFLKRVIREELQNIQSYDKKNIQLLFPEHHLSHAASAFYPSGFEEAAIVTIDGVGEWATASICSGRDNKITIHKELSFPHSLGLLYSAFTYFLGFRVNSGEYKLMGLAPYGNPHSDRVQKYINKIKDQLITIYDDGSLWLNMDYFTFATGLRMVNDRKWEKLFGFPKREAESDLQQHEADLAMAIQKVTEEIVVKMAAYARKITGMDKICLAGGVALNCVANGILQNEDLFDDLFIQPAAGDAGGAVGAALAAYHISFEKSREIKKPDSMSGAFLGPEYHGFEIIKYIRRYNPVYHTHDDNELFDLVAGYLEDGNIVGWFQEKMEFGPRALGARSILADPRSPDMQKKLNMKIKYRETFRPFAPSVLYENVSDYFDYDEASPYMLLVHEVRDELRNELPEGYHELPLREKLAYQRSDLPAITHIDFSARIQTVHRETNPRYWKLIDAFKVRTGYGILVNTSFNVRGEPIVCTPRDAYRCFMSTEMDVLVMENYVFLKQEQPIFTDTIDFKKD